MSKAAIKEYEIIKERQQVLETAHYTKTELPQLATLNNFGVMHVGFDIGENWVGEITLADDTVVFKAVHRSKNYLVGVYPNVRDLINAINTEYPDDVPTLPEYRDLVDARR